MDDHERRIQVNYPTKEDNTEGATGDGMFSEFREGRYKTLIFNTPPCRELKHRLQSKSRRRWSKDRDIIMMMMDMYISLLGENIQEADAGRVVGR